MQLMKQFTKRLNLNISPKTYEKIKQVATKEGRKTGSMARQILEMWAKNRKEQANDGRENIMEG